MTTDFMLISFETSLADMDSCIRRHLHALSVNSRLPAC